MYSQPSGINLSFTVLRGKLRKQLRATLYLTNLGFLGLDPKDVECLHFKRVQLWLTVNHLERFLVMAVAGCWQRTVTVISKDEEKTKVRFNMFWSLCTFC